MIIDFIINTNILTLVFPLSALIYSMLDNPRPSHKYWNFITSYLVVIIFLKFFIQMPIFCNTPAYSMGLSVECTNELQTVEELVHRYDYIIGIHKFNGPASYPYD